jgi:alpha-glucosidase
MPQLEIVTMDQDTVSANWWKAACVYQIYPRSFADANGDGVGDLRGIVSRVPYLRSLGVDAVWLSPFYPSALKDGGYDIDDYRAVDPSIGTLADFDELSAALRSADIKLIVDIVPNHTSDRHQWFLDALAAGRGSHERDRYIFRDGKGPHGLEPPTDWPASFGGSAWTRVDDGQWYLHMFTASQPDLNWDNPEVHADFLATLKFWADRGVAGFRVDVASALAKDLTEPLPNVGDAGENMAAVFDRIYDRDEVHEIYTEWRALFDSYSPPLMGVAEAWVAPERRARYASPNGLGQAFNFDLLSAPWDPGQFRSVITDNLALAAESCSSSTWVFSNHDVVRHATRFGVPPRASELPGGAVGGGGKADYLYEDRVLGLKRARAATLLAFALPGSIYIYQGEELGLPEVIDLPDDTRQDPIFIRSGGIQLGRDGSRVPLPWTRSGPSFGFGDGGAHLPQPAWFADFSVESEEVDPDSTLSLYRKALTFRHQQRASDELAWLDIDDAVLAFSRPGCWLSVTNFGSSPVTLPAGELIISSQKLDADGRLPANATVWLRSGSVE